MTAVHRTILIVDVAGFTDPRRTSLNQVSIRRDLYRLLRLACERSGIPWEDCRHEDRGDGVLALAPPEIPKAHFVDELPRQLASELRAHNGTAAAEEQIRLRIALHAGEVTYDENGVVGSSVNLAFRLLDSAALKEALAGSSGTLAVITSPWFYDEVVWQSPAADRARYTRVRVNVKETDTVAWICLPDSEEQLSALPRERQPGAPHQLPTGTRQFVGRERELAQLTGLLSQTTKNNGTVVITAIDGTAGIGKTTLALHWAHLVKDDFHDGQLYVNLRGFDPREPMEADQALHGFLQALGVGADAIPSEVEAKSALYRSLLADRRMLIVLDNARSAEHVRPLLPASPSCTVLITSRRRLDSLTVHEGAYRVVLDVLTGKDSLALLSERVGRARLAADPVAAAELAELCVRLPLALSIVAARADRQAESPIRELVRELRDERGRLDSLDLGDTDLSLRTVFSWSYNELSPDAARLFRLLGAHPGPDVDLHACGSLVGRTARARTLLGELVRANLIDEHRTGRFRFHDLLRAYATEQARQQPFAAERAEAIEKILKYYLEKALHADKAIQPCRDGVFQTAPFPSVPDDPEIVTYADGIAWFAAEATVLLELVSLAAEEGFPAQTWRLAWACTTYFRRSGRWQERALVHRTALAATRESGDVAAQATVLRHLAPAIARLGDHDEALTLLDEAIGMFREQGNSNGAVAAHLACTRVLEVQRNYAAAVVHAQRAWELVRDGENRLSKGDALTALSRQLAQVGKPAEGLPLCEEALAHYAAVGHKEGEADVLANLGSIEQQLGRHERAIEHYRRSLEIDQELGDRYWEAYTLEHLAAAYLALGDRLEAEQHLRKALVILMDLKHPDAESLHAELDKLRASRER
ncbi:tetratricopeptide repeat protein [Amycolatopsis sp. H20-H5]|uniref:tetratricopeptide repeat protein n=1 Tax=Amycolatopsis sp. H20-H5 TaxID=3046309 RepID=UPI002DB68ECD|nr:tetratricopeptide repeat protein [Amycolatopsis sp. H20-H5]MEC3979201.1 tetratricopeptide repeat protein [Amycolatopsis sp. H20-H5]